MTLIELAIIRGLIFQYVPPLIGNPVLLLLDKEIEEKKGKQ